MSMLSKMKKKTEENRVGNNHPLLSMGVSRNLQDAYLDEIVFASFADDEQIDESERDYLAKVGRALGIPTGEVEETINAFVAADSDGKITRAMESAKTLAGSGLANILLCEFSLVWTSHGQDLTELDECRRQLAEWMGLEGFDYDEKFFALFDEVSAKVKADPKAVYALYDYLDDDVIRYLFADIFEIERIFAEKRDAENRAVLPHPLKIVLDDAQRACYLSAVRSAVNETSDNAPTKIQQKGLRHLAIALGVKDANVAADGKEIILTPNSAMRSLAFFRYCDMARLFAMDGRPAFSAAQKQSLEDVATSFKLVPEDVAFLKEYSAYLGNGKEPDAAEVVHKAQSSICFPDGFIRYFTPNMEPIALASGETAPGVYQIVDGHYRLEKPLKVGSQTRLIIKNAIIDFAPEAVIELNDCATEISDSTFNGEKPKGDAETTEVGSKPFFSGQSKHEIKFENCRFDGADCRPGITVEDDCATIEFNQCQFNRLAGYYGIRGGRELTCYQSIWNDCKAEYFIVTPYESHAKQHFIACDFINCVSKERFFAWSGISIELCLFERCTSGTDFGASDNGCNCAIGSNGIPEYVSRNFVTLDKMREARAKIERERHEKNS